MQLPKSNKRGKNLKRKPTLPEPEVITEDVTSQECSPPISPKERKTSLTQIDGEPPIKKGKKNNPQKLKKEVEIVKTNETKQNDEKTKVEYPELPSEIVERFRKVPLSNNQKGRIRQALRAQLQGSDNTISADILNGKIQAIIKNTEALTDTDLRKVRILYNMLQTVQSKPIEEKKKKKKAKKNKAEKKVVGEKINETGDESQKDADEEVEDAKKNESLKNGDKKDNAKKKGPKRYVVFVGNLPLTVDKEKLTSHFADLSNHIKDIRIPKPSEGKKSAIAFMELSDQSSYEMALSKNHSMLDNSRIKVEFTQQQNSKLTKSEAQGKAAKLAALQKAGKLAGSTALVKKRTHRRNIKKRAEAKRVAAENA